MSQAELLSPASLSPSVSLHAGRPATTSLEVAKFFGKRHTDVLRDVNNFSANCPEEFSQRNFASAEYTDEQGKPRPMFIIYRDGFMLLVMGYTGKKALGMKLAYIEAFNRMEAELAARQQTALSAAPGPDAPAASLPLSTTEDRKPLRALVGSWAQVSGLPFAVCWNQLKAAFQLANIRELPQAWLPDALAWVQEKMDTLTAPLPQTNVPTLAPYTPPVGMSTGREDAMRKIESAITAISAAQDVLRLFCHPGAVTMRMTRQERAMYDAEHTLFAHAIDTLYAARCTLEAGHTLERLRRPQTGRNLSAGRM